MNNDGARQVLRSDAEPFRLDSELFHLRGREINGDLHFDQSTAGRSQVQSAR